MGNQTKTSRKETGGLNGFRRNLGSYFIPLLIKPLAKTSVTPNMVTIAGFLVTLVAAALIVTGHLFAAGFVVLAAGFADLLDGSLARLTNRVTKFGGILDSTLDRLSEASILLALLVMYATNGPILGTWITGITLVSSMMVSYIRSRAETAGIDCEVGIFTRPERVVAFAIGLLFSSFGNTLLIVLGIVAALSVFTVIQRLWHAWKQAGK